MKNSRYTHAEDYTGERSKGTKIGTLWADLENVEGDVTMKFIFDDLDPLARVDILNDLLGMLQRELEYQQDEFRKYLTSMIKDKTS